MTRVGYGSETSDMALAEIWAPSGTRSNTSHWETAVTRVGYGSETSDMALTEIWAPSGTRSNTSHWVTAVTRIGLWVRDLWHGSNRDLSTEWNKVQHITLGNSCDTSRLRVRDLWHGSSRDLSTEWNKVQHITPSGTRSNTSHWETAVTRVGYGSETSDMALAEIWAPSGTRSNTSHTSGTRSNTSHRVEQGPSHDTG